MPPSNKKKQLNSVVACDNKINDNININTDTKHDNSVDNFFGILIDKPPSPINISIDETLNINQQSNTYLDIVEIENKNFNNINNINTNANINASTNTNTNTNTNRIELSKNIIYSNLEIKKKIELLSEHEVTEIFRIIKNNKEKYSTNNNGIFINLSTLKKISIQEISNFLLFCENNNKILDREEQQREIYRELVSEN
jgi:hypothetical protein